MDGKTEEFLQSFDLMRVDLGLGRVKAFLERIGSPQKRMKYVHVAGTNGKGSVCAYAASALQEAGFRTGMYLSPHLSEFGERIQVNGKKIPDSDLERLALELKKEKEKSGIDLSYFEFVTTLAFKHFAEQECDYVALEVGMGGRLDATNVIVPESSVITGISLEHSRYLGGTIGKIAGEKAGIIKQGVPVVSAPQQPEAIAAIEGKCRAEHAKLSLLGRDFSYTRHNASLEGQEFTYSSGRTELAGLKTRMLGLHQFENAALAVRALGLLGLGEDAIRAGLEKAFLPGRFELIHNSPRMIADVAHNPACAKALASNLQEFFPGAKAVIVLGVSEGKDIAGIAAELVPVADSFVCTQAKFRGMDAGKIAQAVRGQGFRGEVLVEPGVKRAVGAAKERGSPLTVFTGSFFSVGEALEFV